MKNLALAAVFAAAATTANATIYEFNFSGGAMDGGEEVPAVMTPANGVENGPGLGGNSFVYDDVSNNLTVTKIRFDGLLGLSSAAHLHNGASGVAGPVVFGLAFDGGVQSGFISLAGQVFNLTGPQEIELLNNRFYVNLHTSAPTVQGGVGFPGGEIRGQLIVVPEASTYAAIGFLGLAGAELFRRRARR